MCQSFNLFSFELNYTTRIKLILWSNLKYKKLIKGVDTTNFLTLKKQLKMFKHPHRIFFQVTLYKLLNVSLLLIFYALLLSLHNFSSFSHTPIPHSCWMLCYRH